MDEQMQQEMYHLTKENNRMLHKMRRNAFWGGIFKFIMWGVILLAPIWFYMTYLSSTVDSALKTIQHIQGTGVKAQTQINDFQQMIKQLQQNLTSIKQ